MATSELIAAYARGAFESFIFIKSDVIKTTCLVKAVIGTIFLPEVVMLFSVC